MAKKQKKQGSEYAAWSTMKSRCYNKSDKAYSDYGGRGIKVCNIWLESFHYFLQDMGIKPTPKHSLDRINNHDEYNPLNCRWATKREQVNNRRNTIIITKDGETRPLSEWAEIIGLHPKAAWSRYKRTKNIFSAGIEHRDTVKMERYFKLIPLFGIVEARKKIKIGKNRIKRWEKDFPDFKTKEYLASIA